MNSCSNFNDNDHYIGRKAMTTIQPKGEKIKQAIKWISNERLEDEKKDLTILICDACLRFNLSPKDEDFLRCFYNDQNLQSFNIPPDLKT